MPQVEVSQEVFDAIDALSTPEEGVVYPVRVVFAIGDDGRVCGELVSDFKIGSIEPQGE